MLVPISMFPFILRLWEGHQNWLSCEQPQKLMKGDDLQGEGLHRQHPTPHSGHKQFPPGRQAGRHSPGHTWCICTGNARVCVSGCLLQSCSAKLLTIPSSCLLHHCSWDLFALENRPFSGARAVYPVYSGSHGNGGRQVEFSSHRLTVGLVSLAGKAIVRLKNSL